MSNRVIGLIVSGSMLSIMSCSPARQPDGNVAPQQVSVGVATVVQVGQKVNQNALPKAVIYKTNRNVDAHVAVILTPDRKGLVSFPAPSDVGAFSTPLHLADGWLLDRRGGIGPNTAFLTYTYSEYAALAETPSSDSIISMLMPEATVTEAYRLDMPLNDALADTAAVNRLIAQGLPGATPLVTSVRVSAPQTPK